LPVQEDTVTEFNSSMMKLKERSMRWG